MTKTSNRDERRWTISPAAGGTEKKKKMESKRREILVSHTRHKHRQTYTQMLMQGVLHTLKSAVSDVNSY